MNILKSSAIASLALLALSLNSALYADDYSFEAGTTFTSNTDNGFKGNSIVAIDLNYYLSPLNSSRGPLAETAFLSKASSVRLGYVTSDIGLNSGPGIHTIQASGQYVLNNDYVLTASVEDSDFDSSFSNDANGFSAGIGKYLDSNTLLGFSYGQNKISSVFTFANLPFGCGFDVNLCDPNVQYPEFRMNSRSTTDHWQVDAKRVWQLGDRSHALKGFVAYDSSDIRSTTRIVSDPNAMADVVFSPTTFSDKSYSKQIGLSYTYYPQNNLGLSIGYTAVDSEFGNFDQIELGTRWFVRDNIALDAGYARFDEGSGNFRLGLTGRF